MKELYFDGSADAFADALRYADSVLFVVDRAPAGGFARHLPPQPWRFHRRQLDQFAERGGKQVYLTTCAAEPQQQVRVVDRSEEVRNNRVEEGDDDSGEDSGSDASYEVRRNVKKKNNKIK